MVLKIKGHLYEIGTSQTQVILGSFYNYIKKEKIL